MPKCFRQIPQRHSMRKSITNSSHRPNSETRQKRTVLARLRESLARVGRPAEWHLDFPKAFHHEAFQFVSRHVEVLVLSMGLLPTPWLEAGGWHAFAQA
jgi:hypothetical protein